MALFLQDEKISGLDMTLLDIPDLVTFWNYANFLARIFAWAQTHEPARPKMRQAKNTLEGYYSLDYTLPFY